jgi:hypothetical protein
MGLLPCPEAVDLERRPLWVAVRRLGFATLELDASGVKLLTHPKSEKQILQQSIYEQQKFVLYLCLSPDRARALPAVSGMEGVRRFEPSLSREKIFV